MSAPEVWFRNPTQWIREVAECGKSQITYDLGGQRKRGNDVFKLLDMTFPAHLPWRMLMMDDRTRTCTEYARDTGSKAVAKHPMWTADMSYGELDKLLELHPERVVVVNPLGPSNRAKDQLMYDLMEIQKDHPDSVLHFKNYTSYMIFNFHFRSVDIDARTFAAGGAVSLPNGKRSLVADPEEVQWYSKWARMFGFTVKELEVPRNRCLFNIKSAAYAADVWHENLSPQFNRMSPRDDTPLDYESANFRRIEIKTTRVSLPRDEEKRGNDYFLCNACTLQTKCDFFRQGAVCSVPGSEPTDLAKFFGSRDSETIVAGLSGVLQFQSNRLMDAARAEHEAGEIDPEVTKMANGLFDRGMKMAKMLDPTLAKPGVQIGIQVNGVPSPGVTGPGTMQKQMLASLIAELEGRGIPRENITPEMLASILSQDDRNRAIEGTVISSKEA